MRMPSHIRVARLGSSSMRKFLALFALVGLIGAPVLSAGPATTGTVSGKAVDAAGRIVAGQRIDLVSNSIVVRTMVTTNDGQWMFADVPAGDYVVRTSVQGRVAGVRVTVRAGVAAAGSMIVTPAASA